MKKFNLDGTDDFKFQWYNQHIENHSFQNGNLRRGIYLGLGCIGNSGTIEIVFVDNKINLILYQDKVVNKLMPLTPMITEGNCIFQQENASMHASSCTKSRLKANNIKILQ